MKGISIAYEKVSLKSGKTGNSPEIHLTPTYANGFCAAFGGGRTNDNARLSIVLREHTSKLFGDIRKILLRLAKAIGYEHGSNEWIDRQLWLQNISPLLNGQNWDYEQ